MLQILAIVRRRRAAARAAAAVALAAAAIAHAALAGGLAFSAAGGAGARAPGGAAASPAPARAAAAGATIDWLTDFNHALEQAEVLRRPVMIDLWAGWCRWCHELDRRTYADPEVIRRSRAMTCAKVNADREQALARGFRIRGLPTILFLDRHGQEIDRVNGFVEAATFAQAMDDVAAAADRSALRAEELEHDPQDPARLYALADELIAQGRLAEAEPLLLRLSPAGPDAGSAVEADAVLDLAVVRAGGGDREAARTILEEFLAAYPESPRRAEAELRLGQLLAEAGAVRAAVTHLEAVATGARGTWKAAEAERILALLGGGAGSLRPGGGEAGEGSMRSGGARR